MTYPCSVCLKKYSTPSNLNKHLKKQHPELSITNEKLNFRCQEQGCKGAFNLQKHLRNHLREEHRIKFEEMEFTVSTMSGINHLSFLYYYFWTA